MSSPDEIKDFWARARSVVRVAVLSSDFAKLAFAKYQRAQMVFHHVDALLYFSLSTFGTLGPDPNVPLPH